MHSMFDPKLHLTRFDFEIEQRIGNSKLSLGVPMTELSSDSDTSPTPSPIYTGVKRFEILRNFCPRAAVVSKLCYVVCDPLSIALVQLLGCGLYSRSSTQRFMSRTVTQMKRRRTHPVSRLVQQLWTRNPSTLTTCGLRQVTCTLPYLSPTIESASDSPGPPLLVRNS